MLPGIRRSYDASIIAVVRKDRSCPGEGNDFLVGMYGWSPPVPYFCPTCPFVFGAIKGHVASENDLRVGGVHRENREADVIGVGAAVGSGEAMGRDLDPRRPAIHGLKEVMFWIAGAEKIKHGVHHAQSIGCIS